MSAELPVEEVFSALREHCMGKPSAVEENPWNENAWKVKGKCFAIGCEGSRRVTVKSTPEKQASLVMHPNIEVAPYVGRFGWVTVDIKDADTLEIARDLIDESYASIVEKRKK